MSLLLAQLNTSIQDEDLGQQPGPPWSVTQPNNFLMYLPDPEELWLPAGATLQVDDEDTWQLGQPPFSATWAPNFQMYLPDPEEIPAGFLVGSTIVDEDLWQGSPPFSQTAGANRPLYLPDGDEIPAGFLSGQPDEDYWQLGSAPLSQTWFPNRPLYQPDPEEIPANTLSGQPDEDYWQLGFPPFSTIGQPNRALYIPDAEEIPANTLHGQPDEDLWLGSPPFAGATYQPNRPLYLPDPEELFLSGAVSILQDEDFWVNPVAPVPNTHKLAYPYLPDAEEIPATTLSGQPDEDYWLLGSLPFSQTWVPNHPVYLPDPEELPARAVMDEDYWQLGSAPLSATWVLNRPLYIPDPEEIPAHGVVDEDFWMQGLLPPIVVASHKLELPYTPDVEEAISITAPANEDYWLLGQPPFYTENSFCRRPPLYIPDPEDLPLLFTPVVILPIPNYPQPPSILGPAGAKAYNLGPRGPDTGTPEGVDPFATGSIMQGTSSDPGVMPEGFDPFGKKPLID